MRAERRSTFIIYIWLLFDCDDYSGLERALLRHVDNIPDLLGLEPSAILLGLKRNVIDSLQYEDEANAGIYIDVMLCYKTRVLAFQVLCIQRENNGLSIDDIDLALITSVELERFLMSGAWHYHNRGMPIVPLNATRIVPMNIPPQSTTTIPQNATTVPRHNEVITPADDIQKGIKRDQSLFNESKNDEDWDEWNRQLIHQVQSQGLDYVLDIKNHKGCHEYDLFTEQQKYMFAVLQKFIETQSERGIVHDKHGSSDEKDQESRKAVLASTDISAVSFILHCCDQCLGNINPHSGNQHCVPSVLCRSSGNDLIENGDHGSLLVENGDRKQPINNASPVDMQKHSFHFLSFEGETSTNSNEDVDDNILDMLIASVTKKAQAGHLAKVLIPNKYTGTTESTKSKDNSVSISVQTGIIYEVGGRNVTQLSKETILGDPGVNRTTCWILSCIQLDHYSSSDVNDEWVNVKGGPQRTNPKERGGIPYTQMQFFYGPDIMGDIISWLSHRPAIVGSCSLQM